MPELKILLTEEEQLAIDALSAQERVSIEAEMHRLLRRLIGQQDNCGNIVDQTSGAHFVQFVRELDFEKTDIESIRHTLEVEKMVFPTPLEIMNMPDEDRERILELSARLAEEEYRTNTELTDFEVVDLYEYPNEDFNV